MLRGEPAGHFHIPNQQKLASFVLLVCLPLLTIEAIIRHQPHIIMGGKCCFLTTQAFGAGKNVFPLID